MSAPSMKYFMLRFPSGTGNDGPVQLPRRKTTLLILALAASAAAALWIHFGLLGGLAATTERCGISELATSDEAKEGTDEQRPVTSKAMRDAAPTTVGSLLGPLPKRACDTSSKGQRGVFMIPSPFQLHFEATAIDVPAWSSQNSFPDDDPISINGATEWSVPAAGGYVVAFTAANDVPRDFSARIWKAVSGGAFAMLESQYYSPGRDTHTGFIGNLVGASWCGTLAASQERWRPCSSRIPGSPTKAPCFRPAS